MNRTKAHQKLIEQTMLLCSDRLPLELRLFSRVTGLLYARRVIKGIISYLRIRVSINGQCDVYGTYFLKLKNITLPLCVELEFKTGKAVLNPDQKIWRDYCLKNGILWFEVRDKYEFLNQLKEKIRLITEAIENESKQNS